MPTTEQKIAVLLELIKYLAESDDSIVKTNEGGDNSELKTSKGNFGLADDNCYYVKIPGNGVIKICP